MNSSFTEACRPTANSRSSFVTQESSHVYRTSLFRSSAGDLTIRAATATATAAANVAATAATKSATGISVLGDGTRAVSRVTLQRVVATPTRLREMLDPRSRISVRQSHCHPLERDEIAEKQPECSLGRTAATHPHASSSATAAAAA